MEKQANDLTKPMQIASFCNETLSLRTRDPWKRAPFARRFQPAVAVVTAETGALGSLRRAIKSRLRASQNQRSQANHAHTPYGIPYESVLHAPGIRSAAGVERRLTRWELRHVCTMPIPPQSPSARSSVS
jgi:hypothetical protein